MITRYCATWAEYWWVHVHFYCQSCRLRWLHLIFLKRDWTLSESKQYFNEGSLSFTANSMMSSVMFLSCERIDASHFWLSGATTTSKDKQRKEISRRVEEHSSASASNVPQSTEISLSSYIDDKKPESLKKVQNTMMQVHQDKNHSISCRSQDLLQLRKMKGLIMMNDLNFSKFILMITKKLKYNNQQDMIVYECVDMTTMHIENELKWRTALSEMHTERSIQFFFAIRRRTERVNCEFVNIQHKVIILI
jgi:hypothetical protein